MMVTRGRDMRTYRSIKYASSWLMDAIRAMRVDKDINLAHRTFKGVEGDTYYRIEIIEMKSTPERACFVGSDREQYYIDKKELSNV